MDKKQTIKRVLIGLIIAIVILIGYSVLSSGSNGGIKQQGSLSSLIGSSGSGQIKETNSVVVNAEILKILGSIENIELHDDIFTNPIFRKLKDTNFAIPRPSKIGRKNPFLPIGFDKILDSQQVQDTEQVLEQDNGGGFFSDLEDNLNQ